MKESKDCKIVQDLLPNYIENLTNEETNKFVEEHLKTCEDCKKIYDNMKKDLNTDNKTKEKKKVKFLKKYRNKLRVLEIIILIIVVAFVVNTGRKVYIITDLNNKAEKYVNESNYHITTYSLQEGKFYKDEVFSMEGKKKLVYTTITDEETQIITMNLSKIGKGEYLDRYKGNIYYNNSLGKNVIIGQEIEVMPDIQDIFKTENLRELLVYSIPSYVTSTKFDGIDSYYISNFRGEGGMYVNKETGLPISEMSYDIEVDDGIMGRTPTSEYKYEFGTVTEDDFTEPDISEYTVQEGIEIEK